MNSYVSFKIGYLDYRNNKMEQSRLFAFLLTKTFLLIFILLCFAFLPLMRTFLIRILCQGKKLFSTESFLKRLFRSSNQSPETLCKLTVSCMVKGHIFTVTVFDSSTCSLCIVPILLSFD